MRRSRNFPFSINKVICSPDCKFSVKIPIPKTVSYTVQLYLVALNVFEEQAKQEAC